MKLLKFRNFLRKATMITELNQPNPRPVTIIDAVTFAELARHAHRYSENTVNDVPWSFKWRGVPFTHETDDRYLFNGVPGCPSMSVRPGELVVLLSNGWMHVVRAEHVHSVSGNLVSEPSEGWLRRMAAAEDRCQSFSVNSEAKP